MADIHEFGIMDYVEKNKTYGNYEPEKYNCISIDGEIIDEICCNGHEDRLGKIETFAHSTERPYKGLAYTGITLIPPKSLKLFLDIIIEENVTFKSKELEMLIEKISQTLKENKFMIHCIMIHL